MIELDLHVNELYYFNVKFNFNDYGHRDVMDANYGVANGNVNHENVNEKS
jgi:hypothetical protein